MHCHASVKRGHLFRQPPTGRPAQTFGPLEQNRAAGLVQPGQLGLVQVGGALERRQPGPVQDLVGIGVADPAEHPRVGQRTLEGMILAAQRPGELGGAGVEHFQAAAVEVGKAGGPGDQMQRGALVLGNLGEQQAAVIEIECHQATPASQRGATFAPVQAPGDHQVQHREQVPFHTPETDQPAPDQLGRRRADAAQNERTGDAHAAHHLPAQQLGQGFHVNGDVRQLGHYPFSSGRGSSPVYRLPRAGAGPGRPAHADGCRPGAKGR